MSGIRRVRDARNRIDNLRRRLAALEANVPDHGAREALLRIEHLTEQAVQGMHPRRFRGVDQAVQHLHGYGPEADVLRAVARYVVERDR